MKKLNLIPVFDIIDYIFDNDIIYEIENNDISTHSVNSVQHFSWDDENYMPLFKKRLIEEFGEDIKKYQKFVLVGT